jgi:PST family polysaccharide transporter
MYLLRFFNQALGFIIIPIIATKFGAQSFGQYATDMAIIAYVVLISDYGFDLNATKNISERKNNLNEVSKIVTVTLFSKLALVCLSGVIIVSYLYLVSSNDLLLISCFFSVVGQILFPTFVFQGLLVNKHIVIVISFTKTIGFLTIIIVLTCFQNLSIVVYPLLLGVFNLLSLMWALFIVKNKLGLYLNAPTFNEVLEALRGGFNFFLVKLGNGFNASIMILTFSFLFSPIIVAYLSISEKIQRAIDGLFIPLIQALFPYFTKHNEKGKVHILYFVSIFFLLLTISIIISIYSNSIILVLFGESYIEASNILSILIFAPPVSYVRNLVTEVYLINWGLESSVRSNIFISSIFAGIYCVVSSSYYGYEAASFTILISELLIIFLSIRTGYRKLS